MADRRARENAGIPKDAGAGREGDQKAKLTVPNTWRGAIYSTLVVPEP